MNNFPPGVQEHHLPGCRPEDIEFENTVADLAEELKEIIDRYRRECPCLGDEEVGEVLEGLMPGKLIPKYRIINAVQKQIEEELSFAEENAKTWDRNMFLSTKRTAKSRLLGVKMFISRLIYKSEQLEDLIEKARERIGDMVWQGPAA